MLNISVCLSTQKHGTIIIHEVTEGTRTEIMEILVPRRAPVP